MDTRLPQSQVLCASIKSKKHSNLRCPNTASRGQFCAKHIKSKILWTSSNTTKHHPLTRRQKNAAEKIMKFWILHGRRRLRRIQGPSLFMSSLSHNDKDIYTFESITTIPFVYHFSFIDLKKHLWTFDLRFLIQLLQYGKQLVNPFSQEPIPETLIQRLQQRSQTLRKRGIPIVYVEKDVLTSEQIWNQKVLDVFLKLTSLGYGVNLLWFETMSVRSHETFHRKLYDLWNITAGLTAADKERIIPGHSSGRSPLFRWNPTILEAQTHELKWWRKQNLNLMNTFVSRSTDRTVQSCGALYVLTALAQTHPKIAEVYPWLV
jgi:hypothetical protein